MSDICPSHVYIHIGNATNGAGVSDQDKEVHETVEDYLVQPPPPSYEYVISSKLYA